METLPTNSIPIPELPFPFKGICFPFLYERELLFFAFIWVGFLGLLLYIAWKHFDTQEQEHLTLQNTKEIRFPEIGDVDFLRKIELITRSLFHLRKDYTIGECSREDIPVEGRKFLLFLRNFRYKKIPPSEHEKKQILDILISILPR